MGSLIAAVVLFGLVYAIAFALSCYYAWVISILWGWFLVPMGAPQVGVLHVIGISLVVGMFTQGLAKVTIESKDKGTILGLLLGPLFTLLFGYVVHSFGG